MTTVLQEAKRARSVTRLAAAILVTLALGGTLLATDSYAVVPTPGSAGTPDTVFNTNVSTSGFSGVVRAVAVQPDGKTLAAGDRLARFNQDGTLDSGFGTGGLAPITPGRRLYGVLVQSDGKVVVGGDYGYLARFNTDGTPDTVFNTNAAAVGLDWWAGPIIQQPSGKLVVGGDFSGKLKRFNTDGTLDTSFGSGGTAAGLNGEVYAMTTQSNGDIVVTGYFTNHLRRFSADGVADSSFNANVAASSLPAAVNVYSVAVQADQKVLVGYWGTNALQRFNTDGTPDSAFNTNAAGLGLGINCVCALAVQRDEKILIGGQFTGYLKRLGADGTIDAGFGASGTAATVPSHVWALQVGNDGKLVVGTESASLMRFFLNVVTTPDAPTGLSATAGDSQATITFTPGADNGSAITNYEYRLDSGAWTALAPASTTSPITITGLTNGTTYEVRLRAINGYGDGKGAASDPVSVTPVAPAPGPSPDPSPSPGLGPSPDPEPSPSPGLSPEPSPTPSSKFDIASSRVRGSSIITRVRVRGAGRIRQRGAYRRARANSSRVRTACFTSRNVAKAGTYTLTCRLKQAVRDQRKKGALRVRIRTVVTPTGGTPRSRFRTIVFRGLGPSFTG